MTVSREHLLQAVSRVLRPIIKILIRSGVRFDEFAELAKGVYVESAILDGLGLQTKPTRARVSVATGVPKRDVDKFIDNEGALPRPKPTLAGILVEVLQKWHTDPAYVGPYGIPLEIEFASPKGRCFEDLVALVDPRADPHEVLDELMRNKSVAYAGQKHLKALTRYFMMPEAMSKEQLEYFGKTIRRLANTLEFNMDPKRDTKRLERFVVADRGVPPDVVPAFEAYARDRANEFLLDLDNWLSPYSARGFGATGTVLNLGLNIFTFVEPQEEEKCSLRAGIQDVE